MWLILLSFSNATTSKKATHSMATSTFKIIGIDCATDATNVGLALGTFDGRSTSLIEITTGSRHVPPIQTILNWLTPKSPTLIALDAPLGWPVGLSTALFHHEAGQAIATLPNQLFRRETDAFIRELVDKQSLDVGADRIARTAYAALKLLGELRATIDESIPLAWQHQLDAGISAIEVYPAATLRSHGFLKSNAATESISVEQAILSFIGTRMARKDTHEITSRHAVDAAVCVLAGADFLQGNAVAPLNMQTAYKEGWIWTKQPESLHQNTS